MSKIPVRVLNLFQHPRREILRLRLRMTNYLFCHSGLDPESTALMLDAEINSA